MPIVSPSNFGRAIIRAASSLTKSDPGKAVVATVGMGHALVFEGEAPGQDLLFKRRPMGAPEPASAAPLAKAHVSGYTREDGTRVEPHERSTVSVKPQAKPQQPAKPQAKPAQDALQRHHYAECAKHEQGAATKGHEHPHHGAHVELAALHQASGRYVRRAVAAQTAAEREGILHGYAHLQRQIAEKGRAFSPEVSPAIPASTAEPMAKSGAVPVLFRPLRKAAPQRGPDLSGLLGEMARAQTVVKSHAGAELWAHGAVAA